MGVSRAEIKSTLCYDIYPQSVSCRLPLKYKFSLYYIILREQIVSEKKIPQNSKKVENNFLTIFQLFQAAEIITKYNSVERIKKATIVCILIYKKERNLLLEQTRRLLKGHFPPSFFDTSKNSSMIPTRKRLYIIANAQDVSA